MNNNIYDVIMAGGRGERFWPRSRNARPKQLQKLLGDRTMLEMTASRLQPLVPPERILVVTNRDYAGQIRSVLPEVPPENIIGEPAARDTGPCVALAAALVAARGGADAVMLTLPADHAIEQAGQLRAVLKDAAELAATRPGWLFTIGVNPTEPATGYGYIHCGGALETGTGTRFFRGLGFKEKPDVATAERFLAAGCYRWNSGMFIWQVRSLMQAFERYAPQLAGLFRDVLEMERRNALETELPERFVKEPRISIDYAVMEKAENVGVAECRFDWDDLGSWPALRNHLKPDSDGNLADGLFAGVDCRNLIVSGRPGHLVAAIGVEDLVIVETEDATLVCRADQAQRIKELLKLADSRPELREFL
ncbi:mannose-1-phosphate guanylyltransferase [Victivallis vadensis]|uniref:mannose-1-phosphate guanylyltransferase n=1 Tax=Victivallis vadensis TaxID=172901 RepID=UPI003AF541E7